MVDLCVENCLMVAQMVGLIVNGWSDGCSDGRLSSNIISKFKIYCCWSSDGCSDGPLLDLEYGVLDY